MKKTQKTNNEKLIVIIVAVFYALKTRTKDD